MRLLLLPGMDGTGVLFERLIARLPSELQATVVRYEGAATLDELVACVEVPDEPYAIVAESFGGALGIELVARARRRPGALVLVSSFLSPPHSPSPGLVALLGPLLFLAPPPRWALRLLLLGSDAPPADVEHLRAVLRTVPTSVLVARLREIQSRDVTRSFLRCRVPMLVVSARADRVLPGRVARDLVALRPDVAHVELEGPHLLLQQRSEEACAALMPFLLHAGSLRSLGGGRA